ncbi:hypothetical protein Z517_06464 [Fonsecaea pedrosoi CBS 271.37]|uniref:Major facilitator superfamily (MFS) profile domain-containing protein n=1 Tax=Fonsecaea pedrosoi CBS 271.37 TaxID=1442368 RepID=A0A0D2H591_9EURO|nr:uncharacterized protein Z517_06464 [Fonsecaea pedrosoi CBS 271.37]KIW79849.1 hypothetical protein Z517_06464 [Fonsecaea pedrosoi CBS 271.37]
MFIVAACALAVFTDSYLYSMVVPILPFALVNRAGVQESDVGPWTSALLACYAAASLAICPVAGYLADYFTLRRTTFILGLLVLAGSTMLLCIGSSMAPFVLGRLLQGASSAITWTTALTVAAETVDTSEVGRTMGFCSLGMSLAMLLGPILGGLLFQHHGYQSVYGLAFGLLAIDIIWRLLIMERNVDTQNIDPQRWNYWTFDYGDDGTPRIVPLGQRDEFFDVESLSWGTRTLQPEDSPGDTSSAVTSQHINHALPKSAQWAIILRDARLQVALWASLVQVTLIASLDAVLPLFVHRIFSWGPQGAGLIFIPVVIPSLLAICAGSIVDIVGPKWVVIAGFSAAAPSLLMLRLIEEDTVGQVVLLCALLLLLSTGLAFVGAPLMAEITFAVEAIEHTRPGAFGPRGPVAQAYAFYYVFVSGGLLIGPLWGGFVEKIAGWKTMTLTFALLSALMVVPTGIFTGGCIAMRRSSCRCLKRTRPS